MRPPRDSARVRHGRALSATHAFGRGYNTIRFSKGKIKRIKQIQIDSSTADNTTYGGAGGAPVALLSFGSGRVLDGVGTRHL